MIIEFGSDGDGLPFQAACRWSIDGGDHGFFRAGSLSQMGNCLLYTSDAADEL